MTARDVLRRIAAEPTVHFAAVAALLFAGSAALKSRGGEVIEIDRESIEWRVREVERARGARLDPHERGLAERAFIDEHVLARAARERGLDDDARIRGILYQKMLQVLSSTAVRPTEQELAAYYERNRSRYGRPAAVTLEQRVASGGAPPRQSTLDRATRSDLALAFGADAADAVFTAAIGDAVGPFRTGDGEYTLRVVARNAPEPPPPFAAVRDQVRFDLIAEREDALLKARIAELRARYIVRVTDETARR